MCRGINATFTDLRTETQIRKRHLPALAEN